MSENQQGICRAGLIVLVAISLVLCSLSGGISQGTAAPALSTPFQTLPPVNATLATPIGQATPGPTPIPTIGLPGSIVYIEGDKLVVGSDTYPIGDDFSDASGIPLGASTTSLVGDFGYAAIKGIEDFLILWITDDKGNKHYIIVSASDPLFVGHKDVKDGFIHYLEFLKDAENGIMWGMGGAGGGLIGATVAQLVLCAPTAGATCLSAIATAFVGGIAGLVKLAYHFIFDYLPQMHNLREQFEAIDTLRPKEAD